MSKVRVVKSFSGRDGFTYIEGKTYDLPEERATCLKKAGLVKPIVSREIKIKVKHEDKPEKVEVKFDKQEDEEKDGK